MVRYHSGRCSINLIRNPMFSEVLHHCTSGLPDWRQSSSDEPRIVWKLGHNHLPWFQLWSQEHRRRTFRRHCSKLFNWYWWKEEKALIKSYGANAYRFSLSWSRIVNVKLGPTCWNYCKYVTRRLRDFSRLTVDTLSLGPFTSVAWPLWWLTGPTHHRWFCSRQVIVLIKRTG